jgi:hypothetical protein
MTPKHLRENQRMEMIKQIIAKALHNREVKPLIWNWKEKRWI